MDAMSDALLIVSVLFCIHYGVKYTVGIPKNRRKMCCGAGRMYAIKINV